MSRSRDTITSMTLPPPAGPTDEAPTLALRTRAPGATSRPALDRRTPRPGGAPAPSRLRLVLLGTRTRLLASYVVLLSLATLVSVVALQQVLAADIDTDVAADLAQEREEFQQLATGTNPLTGQPFGDDLPAIVELYLDRNVPAGNEAVFTFVDGAFFAGTPAPRVDLAQDPALVERWTSATAPVVGSTLTTEGDVEFLAVPVLAGGAAEPTVLGTFVVVEFTEGLQENVREAVRTAAVVDLAVLLVASVAAWGVAGRALSPLRRMTDTARRIQAEDVSQRIPVSGGRDEVAELGRTFNAMLDRLEGALDAQRQLTGDVGHELRTPITIVRGHLEVMGDDPQDRRETVALVVDELDRMARLVDDLLLLARSERADFLLRTDVDAGVLVREAAAKAEALGDRRWVLDGVADVRTRLDPQRVTQALLQLAANAVKHTPRGSAISIGSAVEGADLHVWVRDTGDGIDPADQERVFERFVRGQSSRGEGNGLGLSLVRAIAVAHGGRVDLVSATGQGARFTLVLPLVASTETSSATDPFRSPS